MPHQPFSGKDDLKKRFWVNIHFGTVRVWCCVTQTFFQSIHFAKYRQSLFYSSFSSNHPDAKWLVWHEIVSIPPPKHQRRPFPSLLSDSYSSFTSFCVRVKERTYRNGVAESFHSVILENDILVLWRKKKLKNVSIDKNIFLLTL